MKVNWLTVAVSREAGLGPGWAGRGRKGPGLGGCGRSQELAVLGGTTPPRWEPGRHASHAPALTALLRHTQSRVHGHMQSHCGLISMATAERAAAATQLPQQRPPTWSSAAKSPSSSTFCSWEQDGLLLNSSLSLCSTITLLSPNPTPQVVPITDGETDPEARQLRLAVLPADCALRLQSGHSTPKKAITGIQFAENNGQTRQENRFQLPYKKALSAGGNRLERG